MSGKDLVLKAVKSGQIDLRGRIVNRLAQWDAYASEWVILQGTDSGVWRELLHTEIDEKMLVLLGYDGLDALAEASYGDATNDEPG